LEVNLSVKLKTRTIPDFIHNQYSAEYQPRDYLGAYKPLAAIYLLRLAIGLQKQLTVQNLSSLFAGGLAKLTGLTEQDAGLAAMPAANETVGADEAQADTPSITKAKLVKEIRCRLKQLIKQGMSVNAPLFTNLKELAITFDLTAADQEILILKILMYLYPDFKSFLNEHWPDVTDVGLYDYLHLLTARPIADIENSLAANSPLQKLGWISIVPLTLDLEEKLALPPLIFDVLLQAHGSVRSMLNRFFNSAPPSQLTLANNVQLQQELDVIVPYLEAALATKQAGANILVHAGAGAETVELVSLMAQSLGASLVKINDLNPDGTPMPQQHRLLACQFTQEYLQKQPENKVILIDAAEHLFVLQDDWMDLEDGNSLNYIDETSLHRQLQTNPVPIIWMFNKAVGIAPKIFKHFAYTWDISKIPVCLRQQLIEQATADLNLSPRWVNQLARQTDIQLEQIRRAAAVAKLTGQVSTVNSEMLMLHTLNARRRLYKQSPVQSPACHQTGYDLRFTNTSTHLADLITGLSQSPRGNFCFYGAPGTGKTAFAHHIAEQLGLPLLIKRASDLIDKYVGESEKNIARMFAEAQQQDAILLLDEADSLLGDRRDAHRRWEISQVNEMLTQMERFGGIFICTTNLMEKLDAASLRRFDFKVKFDYLNREQRWELFIQEAQRMGTTLPSDAEALTQLNQQVQRLTQLTPGDFAVANRQATLLGKALASERMLAVLAQECEAKGETFARIGFVH
jgi:transitional endoplasmic reticulum ATPase